MENINLNKQEADNSDLYAVRYSFTHSGYELSTDYKKLWNLVQSGQRIPAYLIYTDKYEKPIWDLVEVKNIRGEPNDYSIGTRGIGYEVCHEIVSNQIISELKVQLNDAIDIIADVRSENINMVIDGESPLITEQLRQRIQNILNSNGR